MKPKTFQEQEVERLTYLINKIKKDDFSGLPADYKTYPKEDLLKKLEEERNYFNKFTI
jgi:hypothetical protein